MIYNIRGTNGTGKTTVVRRVLEGIVDAENAGTMDTFPRVVLARQSVLDPTRANPGRMVVREVKGTVAKNEDFSVCAIGTYKKNCGGCDEFSWKGAHDALCDAIRVACDHYDFVMFEGMTVSGIFQRYVDLAAEIQGRNGKKTTWVHLEIPTHVSEERIVARTGRPTTDRVRENVLGKKQATVRCIQRAKAEAPHILHSSFEDSFAAADSIIQEMFK
jgi:hypothetical protein